MTTWRDYIAVKQAGLLNDKEAAEIEAALTAHYEAELDRLIAERLQQEQS